MRGNKRKERIIRPAEFREERREGNSFLHLDQRFKTQELLYLLRSERVGSTWDDHESFLYND
jgi:hypothetical protein